MLHDDELDAFEEMMDLGLPEIKIGNYVYLAGEALRKLDPIAFREECLRWVEDEKGCQFERINDTGECFGYGG